MPTKKSHARTEVELAAELERIRGELLEAEAQACDRLSSVHPDPRESARKGPYVGRAVEMLEARSRTCD